MTAAHEPLDRSPEATARRRSMEMRGDALARELGMDVGAYRLAANLHWAFVHMKTYVERAALSESGLSLSAFVALWSIYVNGEMEASEVAEEVGIARSSFSGLAGRLEGRGLLERIEHPADGRSVLCRLTPDGERAVRAAWPRLNDAEIAMAEHLDAAERSELAGSLRTFADSVADLLGGERT